MRHLGYTSCPANPDLWYKEVKQPETGVSYYSYILIYVDDILCIHHDTMPVLVKLNKYFTLDHHRLVILACTWAPNSSLPK